MSQKAEILCALALRYHGAQSFTKSDIVVTAWERSRQAFGLAGWETQFPDANRVLCKLYGARGLVARGHVAAAEPGRFRVTPEGYLAADRARRA